MNPVSAVCGEIERKLSMASAANPDPGLDPAEVRHAAGCDRCGPAVAAVLGLLADPERNTAVSGPDPAYLAMILPRIRARMASDHGPARSIFGAARIVMPAAGAIAAALLLLLLPGPGPGGGLESLTGTELHELTSSGDASGLLGPEPAPGAMAISEGATATTPMPAVPGSNAAAGSIDVLDDLLADSASAPAWMETVLALAGPEELLRRADEDQFMEIAGLLEPPRF